MDVGSQNKHSVSKAERKQMRNIIIVQKYADTGAEILAAIRAISPDKAERTTVTDDPAEALLVLERFPDSVILTGTVFANSEIHNIELFAPKVKGGYPGALLLVYSYNLKSVPGVDGWVWKSRAEVPKVAEVVCAAADGVTPEVLSAMIDKCEGR